MMRKEEKEQPLLYTLGTHISVYRPVSFVEDMRLHSIFTPQIKATKQSRRYPSSIDEKAIIDSFKKLPEKIKLFKSEKDALEYSRSLRRDAGASSVTVYQPPIIKVQYRGEVGALEEISETISFYKLQGSDWDVVFTDEILQTLKPGDGCSSKDKESDITIFYYEVPKIMVVPYSGALKIQYAKGQSVQEYAEVLFQNDDDIQEMGYSGPCVIL